MQSKTFAMGKQIGQSTIIVNLITGAIPAAIFI